MVGQILAAGFGFNTCALGIHCVVNTSLQSDESINSCQSAALVQINDVLWHQDALHEGSILKSISQSRGCNQLEEDTNEMILILMILKHLLIDFLNKN